MADLFTNEETEHRVKVNTRKKKITKLILKNILKQKYTERPWVKIRITVPHLSFWYSIFKTIPLCYLFS